MKIEDIRVGETYKMWEGSGTFKVHFVGKELVFGTANGTYETIAGAGNLQPIPKRYLVEHRLPKVGERYFFRQDIFMRTGEDGSWSPGATRGVIVEEL